MTLITYHFSIREFGSEVVFTIYQLCRRMKWFCSSDNDKLIIEVPADDVEIFEFIFADFI